MPESVIRMVRFNTFPFSFKLPSNSISIRPCSVNFTALLPIFIIIWAIRSGSPITCGGIFGFTVKCTDKFFSFARSAMTAMRLSNSECKEKLTSSIFNLPASIFEKSRISLITLNNICPEYAALSRYPLTVVDSSCCCASSISPIMPFIGVRIS